jgi:hypothetical protein
MQHDAKRRRWHWLCNLQLGQRPREPREVTPFVDQPAFPYLTDLIDAIGKLIAAIFDIDFGVVPRKVSAVNVCNT